MLWYNPVLFHVSISNGSTCDHVQHVHVTIQPKTKYLRWHDPGPSVHLASLTATCPQKAPQQSRHPAQDQQLFSN